MGGSSGGGNNGGKVAKSKTIDNKKGYKNLGVSPATTTAIVGSQKSKAELGANLAGVSGTTTKSLGDLQQRAQVGQLSKVPTALGQVANLVGKLNAKNIQSKIAEGGTPVTDSKGNIQGVTHDNFMGQKVYSGNSAFNPMSKGKSSDKGGYEEKVVQAKAAPKQASNSPSTAAPKQQDTDEPTVITNDLSRKLRARRKGKKALVSTVGSAQVSSSGGTGLNIPTS